jgi:hypothetical protein
MFKQKTLVIVHFYKTFFHFQILRLTQSWSIIVTLLFLTTLDCF